MVTTYIGSRAFATQKEAMEYVRNTLKGIGATRSVKSTDSNVYSFLLQLCERHPNKDQKLEGMIDFVIQPNPINKKHLALFIKKSNNDILDISWITCVKGKPNTHKAELRKAMRYAIEYQVQEYRSSVTNKRFCQNCLTSKKCEYHIHHHINEFEDIVKGFLTITKAVTPTQFDEDKTTYQRVFHEDDFGFEKDWQLYHKQHATLQFVCKTCNLSTLKSKKQVRPSTLTNNLHDL
jgi:hypothetical protein